MISLMNEYVHGAATIPISVIICIAVLSIVFHVFAAIGLWKMFTKAGVKGWYSLIPVVNNYQLFKIAGCKKTFFWWIAFKIVSSVTETYHLSIDEVYNHSLHVALTVVCLVCLLGAVDLIIHRNFKLSMAFGKGGGFAVLMTFFYSFCYIILGLGNAEYYAESVVELKDETPSKAET